ARVDEAVGIGADDDAADDMVGAGAGAELFAPALDKSLGARAQMNALGALGTGLGRMRRMALGQKFLADLVGDLALERGDNLLFAGVSHASHAEIRPHVARIGPFAKQLDQRIVV